MKQMYYLYLFCQDISVYQFHHNELNWNTEFINAYFHNSKG